jgi:benzoylformate decarboxylase
MLRRAFRTALTPPTGPVFLALPLDVMQAETTATPEPLGHVPDAGAGDPDAVARAADLLAAADDPVLVVGDHVARAGRRAVDAAVEFAEATGARVHGEILSAEVSFPGDHDRWGGFAPSSEAGAREVTAGDVVAFVGCSTHTTPVRHDSPLVDPGTDCIHVGPDPWQLGKNEPSAVSVVGDPGRVLSALAAAVRDRPGAAATADGPADGRGIGGDPPAPDDTGGDARPSKERLVDALRTVVPDAFVVDEGVTSKYVLLDRWPLSPEQFVSNKGGGLGYGLPAAVGASLAESMTDAPRPVVSFVGDGSFLYYPHAVYTAVRLGLDVTIVVVDNRNYRILKDNMLSLQGGEEADYEFLGVDFDPAVDIPATAAGQGARTHRVETVDDLEPTLADAVSHAGVDLVDVHVDD